MSALSEVKRTKIRKSIEHIFQANPEPLSLQELFYLVRKSNATAAFSTVYRQTLKLEKEGKIIRIDWRERGSRYEWAELPHHHHLICQACGRIIDLDCELFGFKEKDLEKLTGFAIRRHSIEFEGICLDCRSKS